MYVLERIDEKRALLKEASQFVVSCLFARIQPQRGLQKKEIEKITKGSLIEGLKEIERLVLTINIEKEDFCSDFFIQSQKLRRAFLIAAIIQTLENASIKEEYYNLLFEPEFTSNLLECQQRPKRVSIKPYKNIKKSSSCTVDSLVFIKQFSCNFLVEEERMILNNMKD
ncbi:hypothetical protein [Peribacillus frigoritolerans]|uniref:hypothetical protein n=1 Tax=Peribacillus frigoritolerans TaxID=450367 RepID=UPI0025A26318|nr:hypothetical protein [Peribacillus frigoritolerans]MDM5310339.1 hypothetical protein [Peribacillus frigoritolerans]